MNQVQDGLYAVEETMPCSPKDIRVGRYALPSTLQRAEREEAAARIITFSQQLDQWVGVSWARLGQMMQEDFLAYKEVQEAEDHNWKERLRVQRAVGNFYIRCFLTLGIYALFVSKPTAQIREIARDKIVFTTILIMGPQAVVTGIHELIEKGMLRHAKEGEGENALDVFFPTPLLISTIMQKQGVVAS